MEVNASKLRLGAQRLLQLTANESEDNVFAQSLQKFIKKQVSELAFNWEISY